MGQRLMQGVVTHWGHLPGNAYKALMVMAATARDDQALYWGGWERIALGLGRRDWPADEDESLDAERLRAAHLRRVQAALTDLERAGAIVVEVRAAKGRRAEYRLCITPVDGDGNRRLTVVDDDGKRRESTTESVASHDGNRRQRWTETVHPTTQRLLTGTRGGTQLSPSHPHLRDGVGR